MKAISFILILLFLSSPCAFARGKQSAFTLPGEVQVREYVRKDGTRVRAHRRTGQNRTEMDNWSTYGNVNPYTGKKGTKRPRW